MPSELHLLQARVVEALFLCAPCVFIALLLITVPYGRHQDSRWGPTVGSRAGWLIMEMPAVVLLAWFFLPAALASGGREAAWVLFVLWEIHYVFRTFVDPLRHPSGRPMALAVVLLAFAYQAANSFVNGLALATAPHLDADWLLRPEFLCGVALFLAGAWINRRADAMLRNLRRPGETGYRIPEGWLYERVSCPNYLGEILEWTGFALAAWTPAAAAFAVFSFANLVPRALAHHRWYKDTFPEYPAARRAVIPYLI